MGELESWSVLARTLVKPDGLSIQDDGDCGRKESE